MSALALLHAAVTWTLVGLIWTVQLVHYPLFAGVGRSEFRRYHERHAALITRVVGPLMLAEAVAAIALWADPPAELRGPATVGLVLVGVNWASTAFLQMPEHARLGAGFDEGSHRRLVATNWLRTAAWTVRGGVAVALLGGGA